MNSKEKITHICLNWAKAEYDKISTYHKEPHRQFSVILSQVRIHFKDDEHFKRVKDPEQSWKTVLGHVLEGLIEYALEKELMKTGLKCSKPTKKALLKNYKLMEEQLSVEVGGIKLLPDVDRVVYQENPFRVIAILSIKKKFRERIAQVGYWTIQLRQSGKDVKNIMVTTDENGTFTKPKLKKDKVKAKAIAYAHTNGTFVATEAEIEENGKVKRFNKIIEYLREIIKNSK